MNGKLLLHKKFKLYLYEIKGCLILIIYIRKNVLWILRNEIYMKLKNLNLTNSLYKGWFCLFFILLNRDILFIVWNIILIKEIISSIQNV